MSSHSELHSEISIDELFNVDPKEFAGSQLMLDIVRALQLAFAQEKSAAGLTQQSVADRLGLTNRSVVNKWLNGHENMTVRTIGELAWALNRRSSLCLEPIEKIAGCAEPVSKDSIKMIAAGGPEIWKQVKPQFEAQLSVEHV